MSGPRAPPGTTGLRSRYQGPARAGSSSSRTSAPDPALEPICPLPWVRRLHGRFPFHPFPFLATERELDFADLRRIEALFGRVECKFFDLVTRESISVLLFRLGIRQTITRLGSLDAFLLRHIPGLKGLASYVILRATRA